MAASLIHSDTQLNQKSYYEATADARGRGACAAAARWTPTW